MKAKREKYSAKLVIHGISSMDQHARKSIIAWLRRQASDIEKLCKIPGFAKRFTATRY